MNTRSPRMSNELITEADERTIRHCAASAIRQRNPGLELQDMKQQARLMLLRSVSEGRMPTDPEHRGAYVYRRCWGSMIDLHNAAERQQPRSVASLDEAADVSWHRGSAPGVDRQLQVRQAIERIERLGHPQLIRCIELLAAGHEAKEVAEILGVHPSRVSKLRAKARELVACCL